MKIDSKRMKSRQLGIRKQRKIDSKRRKDNQLGLRRL